MKKIIKVNGWGAILSVVVVGITLGIAYRNGNINSWRIIAAIVFALLVCAPLSIKKERRKKT